jgi:hypothetical protein
VRRLGRKSEIVIAWEQDEVERVVFLQESDGKEEIHLLSEGRRFAHIAAGCTCTYA